MADAEPAPAPAAPPAKSNILPILLGVNGLLVVGVVAVLFLRGGGGTAAAAEHKEAAKAEASAEGGGEKGGEGGEAPAKSSGGSAPSVRLSDFVIHLKNPEVDRYARFTFEVEVTSDNDKERINSNLPKIRDAFISMLSDKSLEDLRGSEGLTATKQALFAKLAEIVPTARLRAIYITEFVIQ
jgi:flagellar FliL protein